MTKTTATRILGAALALTILGAAACEDDAPVSSEACDAAIGYSAAVAGMPQDPAAMGGYVKDEVLPVVTTLVHGLPEDVDGRAFLTAVERVAETGDPTPLFEDADAVAAQEAIGAAVHDSCDFGTIDVEASEYGFDGIEDVDAGRTSIRFENVGAEEHELVLFKIADGVDADAEALLALPEEEQMAKMQFAGVTFGGPGSTAYAALELDAGEYLAVCFIPTGGDEAAPPHFARGMHATFTVAG